MTDVLISVASKAAEYLVKPVKDQLRYIFCFKSIAASLSEENHGLTLLQERVQHQVNEAQGNGEEIERDVREWLQAVCTVQADVEALKNEMQHKKIHCNVCQYKLSRKAAKKTSSIASLQARGTFDHVGFHSTPCWGEFLSSDAFRRFSTTEIALTQTMEALRGNETQMIGIYGMGGVGKTTLVKEVGKIAIQSNLFDHVFTVVVSQEPNVRRIQGQMADMLGIELREESEPGRARHVWTKLKSECEKLQKEKKEKQEKEKEEKLKREKDEKKQSENEKPKIAIKEKEILIILDDVWGKIDLQAIGINFSAADQRSCKILLTTRRQHVCTSMGCQRKIELNVLSEKEAWDLFQENTGVDAAMEGVAMEVARECKGLPIALVTVGRALRDKHLDEWKMALKRLQSSRLDEIEDVESNVYECLKLSYDYLDKEETKFCFLLCSLFPEDHVINVEDLTMYLLGIGLCQDVGSTMEEARLRVRVIVNSLKASCLLLDAGSGNHVVMHDVVRDVALWIATKGKNMFLVKTGSVVQKWPAIGNSENCTAISLVGHSISDFSDTVPYPKLQILLLHGVRNPITFSDGFFKEMSTLEVLDIGYTHKDSRMAYPLPQSLQFLTNLESLSIRNCSLQDISVLGKLKKLKFMYFCRCDIYEFPAETFDLLQKLTLLKMSACSLGRRSAGVAVQMVLKLEELDIDGRIWCRWRAEGKTGLRREELLPCLYVGSFNFANAHDSFPCTLNYVMFSGIDYITLDFPMEAFQNTRSIAYEFLKEVDCFTDTSAHVFANLVELYLHLSPINCLSALCHGLSPKGFLERLKKLELISCDKMCSVFPAFLLQSLQDLEKLSVHGCDQVEHVFEVEETDNMPVLSNFGTLELEGLPKLKHIWKGPSRRINLHNLAHVQVRYCRSLVSFLSPILASGLVNLEVLELFSCEKLEQIVMDEDDEARGGTEIVQGNNVVVLPRLWCLKLQFLPSLVRLCPENVSIKCPLLEKLTVTECGIAATCSAAYLKTTLLSS